MLAFNLVFITCVLCVVLVAGKGAEQNDPEAFKLFGELIVSST